MNIFVLSHDPRKAARYHNDRHVVKMILETAQILATAHYLVDGHKMMHRNIGPVPLRPTHIHHPCVRWACENQKNYFWLWELGEALLDEYTLRYGKTHKFDDMLRNKLFAFPINLPPADAMTKRPLCMPDQFKSADPVASYRAYYFREKRHIASWKSPASTPTWWTRLERLDAVTSTGE